MPRAHADLLPKNISDPLPTQLKNDLDVLPQKSIEEEKETRKLKARQAFEGQWLREIEKELYECVEKSHQTRDPYLRANLKAYVEVLCNKLKPYHQSLGTYKTAEAIQERRGVGVDLGILRQQDQHLVRCVHEQLPTKSDLEFEEVTTESAQGDDENMFLTPLPASDVVPASVPDDWAISDGLLCLHGTKRPRYVPRRSQPETPNKRSKNAILNYFHNQKN